MSRIDALADKYQRHIAIPWQRSVAGAQRIIMVVYDKEMERTIRAQKGEFHNRTLQAGHDWLEVDLTDAFASFMAADEYRDAYFEEPEFLGGQKLDDFRDFVVNRIRMALTSPDATPKTVVALFGVGSIFGFCRLSEVLPRLDRDIQGRLAVFFPGHIDRNNYRLLDARDGWNYLAVPISLRGEN